MTRQRITLVCHLWCRDLDITWLKQPPRGRGQAQPEPNSAKLPRWRRNAKKIQRKGRPIVPEPGQRKAHAAVSDPRRPPVKVRGPRSSGWRDMPNEILIPVQSLIPCYLEPPANRRAAEGTTEGLWRAYSSACPKGAICRAPVAVTQAGGGSSVLSLLRQGSDQRNSEHRSDI